MNTILICDDDKDIVSALDIYLTSEGYATVKAYDGLECLRLAEREPVDLILLDVMMPGLDGIRTTAKLRESCNVPIILLTAKSEDSDKILGLNIGADDYITKPFGWRELFARIEVALRRSQPSAPQSQEDNALRVKDLAIYPDKYVVEQDGRRVDLTPTEFGILRVLAEHRGNIVTRNELNEALGITNNGGEIRSLDVHMRNLRKKLGDDIQECRYIETIRRIGFRVNE